MKSSKIVAKSGVGVKVGMRGVEVGMTGGAANYWGTHSSKIVVSLLSKVVIASTLKNLEVIPID